MSATIEAVKAEVANTASLLNKKAMLAGAALYVVFYGWVRWYEGVYGWSAGLDSSLVPR